MGSNDAVARGVPGGLTWWIPPHGGARGPVIQSGYRLRCSRINSVVTASGISGVSGNCIRAVQRQGHLADRLEGEGQCDDAATAFFRCDGDGQRTFRRQFGNRGFKHPAARLRKVSLIGFRGFHDLVKPLDRHLPAANAFMALEVLVEPPRIDRPKGSGLLELVAGEVLFELHGGTGRSRVRS